MDSELSKIMFTQTIEKYHKGLNEFIQGNAAPILEVFSEQEDVSLANPMNPAVLGRQNVVEATQSAAAAYREGKVTGFENLVKVVTPDLGYIVEIEKYMIETGEGQELVPVTLRATSIFRMEAGGWKLLHRHANPVVPDLKPETLVLNQAF